jgi:hypothetical protein
LDRQYQFHDLSGRTKWLRAMLIINLLAEFVSASSDILRLELFSDMHANLYHAQDDFFAVARWTNSFYTFSHAVPALPLTVCIACYFLWLYRANSNLHALGATGIRSPGWAVGGNFVPVANIGLGFEAMAEIWKASLNPADWRTGTRPALMPIWWLAWLAGNAIAWYLLISHPSPTSTDQWELARYAADAISNLTVFWIVGRIDHMQASLARAVSQ